MTVHCIIKWGHMFRQNIWSSSGHKCMWNQNYNSRFHCVSEWDLVPLSNALVLCAKMTWRWPYNWSKPVATFYNLIICVDGIYFGSSYFFVGCVTRHGIRTLTSKITYLEAVVLSEPTRLSAIRIYGVSNLKLHEFGTIFRETVQTLLDYTRVCAPTKNKIHSHVAVSFTTLTFLSLQYPSSRHLLFKPIHGRSSVSIPLG